MTVTSGFFDSLTGDRKYNADQLSRLFEGIITDGIFMGIGDAFVVSPQGGMNLTVGSGRGWFNNTWINNDANATVSLVASPVGLNRIDTVVIEINKNTATRANRLTVVTGTAASSPVAPTLTNAGNIYQYPLADVYVGAGVSSITGGNITNRIAAVGGTPFITGVIDSVDISTLLAQYEADFNLWFSNLQDQLDDNQAGNLQNQIDTINTDMAGFTSDVSALSAQVTALDGDVATAESNITTLTGVVNNNTYAVNGLNNYTIAVSVSANNLIIALKTLAGTDATPTNPITLTVGSLKVSIQTAFSHTIAAGTNWMNAGSAELGGKDIDFFVYIINQTGASAGIKFGISRIPYANVMGDFVNSQTHERYIAGNLAAFNVTDVCRVIGRIRARLSLAAGYTWSIPSYVVIHHPYYETDNLSWTPTLTGFSGTPTIALAIYRVVGKEMHVIYRFSGTSNATTMTYTLPFTPAPAQVNNNIFVVQRVTDNSVVATGIIQATTNNIVSCYKDMAGNLFTASGLKGVDGSPGVWFLT